MGCIGSRSSGRRKRSKDMEDFMKEVKENYESSRARFPAADDNPITSVERWSESERKLARMREEKAREAALAAIKIRAAERAANSRKERIADNEEAIARLRERPVREEEPTNRKSIRREKSFENTPRIQAAININNRRTVVRHNVGNHSIEEVLECCVVEEFFF